MFLVQAFETIKLFLGKLEKISEDPAAAEQQQKEEGKHVHQQPAMCFNLNRPRYGVHYSE